MPDWWEERKKQVEPVRGMVGSLLSGMSPEAKEQYFEDQERVGGPFLRTASEALVGMLEEPISPLGMAPAGIMKLPLAKTMLEAYPHLSSSEVAKFLRQFSMETLDPLRDVGVLSPEALKAITGRELQGTRFSPELASKQVPSLLAETKRRKVPIRTDLPSLSAFKGEPSVYLSKKNVEPLQVLGHELGHGRREQMGAKYSVDLPFEMNPEEAIVDAIGHLSVGKSKQSTIARLLERFRLPEEDIYKAVEEAERTLRQTKLVTKPTHYETLPERKSIARQAEKVGGPRRKNPYVGVYRFLKPKR